MIDRLIDELNSCFLFSFHFLEQLWSRVQYYPPKQFNEWNRMISTFIWENKSYGLDIRHYSCPKIKVVGLCPVWRIITEQHSFASRSVGVIWSVKQNGSPVCVGKSLLKKYLLGDKLSNWIATPLNISYKKYDRNARLLRWVAFDTEFTPAELDSRFTQ